MTAITLILFDLNGVLYTYDRSIRIAALGAVSGRPAPAIEAGIWDSGFEDEGDAGMVDADAYLAGFGTRMGYRLTEAEWVAAQQAALTPIAACLGLIARLRPTVRSAVLTNNNLLVKRHFAALYPEIGAIAGSLAFVSAEFGARKPDPEAYRRCLHRIGVAPANALFVDDSAANVAGAKAAGLHVHRFIDPPALEARLRALALLR